MKKLEHLNGLRGLAAFVVVMHHFAYIFMVHATQGAGALHFPFEPAVYATPLQLLVAGNFAVCIFFILSGFVLSYAFFQSGDAGLVRSAAIKRYFRLMPPILASVLVSWGILKLGLNFNHPAAAISGSPWLENFWPRAVSFWEALQYGTWGIIVGNAEAGLLNNALWTMKVEFFGSMLVFGFLAVFGRLHYRWVAYLVVAILSWDTYYLAFVMGIALCDATSSGWSPRRLSWPAVAALVAGGLLLGAAPIPGPTGTWYDALAWPGADRHVVFVLTHIAGAFLLLCALVFSPGLQGFFASRPLRYLGKISFSMYLLHVPVLGSFASYLFGILHVSHGYGFSVMLTGGAYLVIVLIAADIFTRYVDEPSIRLASYVRRKLMASRPPEAGVSATSKSANQSAAVAPNVRAV